MGSGRLARKKLRKKTGKQPHQIRTERFGSKRNRKLPNQKKNKQKQTGKQTRLNGNIQIKPEKTRKNQTKTDWKTNPSEWKYSDQTRTGRWTLNQKKTNKNKLENKTISIYVII